MRIVAGEFRGRPLKPPADTRVRPTADRIREAWFSIVGDDVRGANVLDLFAGSGALGLEALSRGARAATFVELAAGSLAALRANIEALGVEKRATMRRADAIRFVKKLPPGAFDMAFADPPYGTGQAERLAALYAGNPFAGLLGVEHPSGLTLEGGDRRTYGNVCLTFFRTP